MGGLHPAKVLSLVLDLGTDNPGAGKKEKKKKEKETEKE